MRRCLRFCVVNWLVLFAAGWFGQVSCGQTLGVDAIQVRVGAETGVTLSRSELRKLPRQSVTCRDRDDHDVTYDGIPLDKILQRAGVELGASLRGNQMTLCLIAEARDGYRVVYALAETDPAFKSQPAILATHRDGQLLGEEVGPWQIVVPGEMRGARWIRQVASLVILQADSVDAPQQIASEEEDAEEADARSVKPVWRAHAHNDYYHQRPLLDALEQGFASFEADVFLVNDQLLVGHSRFELKPLRTLQSLYLEPLRDRAAANGGWIYEPGRSVTLLVDIKADGEAAYARLRELLRPYRELLTMYRGEQVETRAITIVLSGDRPIEAVATKDPRWVAIDGRPSDLEAGKPAWLYPIISDSWRNQFTWNGRDELPPAERDQMRSMSKKAHANGQRLRFWGSPDRPAVWRAQLEAGVDLINTDKLEELSKFLRSQ